MPNFKAKIKAHKEIKKIDVIANDMDSAQRKILSENPACEIIDIEQKGPGGIASQTTVAARSKKGGLKKKLILVISITATAAIAYYLLKKQGML